MVDEAGQIVDAELNPQLAKVRADHRRWLASRLNRNKYGDKLEVNHKNIIDIVPALLENTKRMQSIGVGNVIDAPVEQFVESELSDTNII